NMERLQELLSSCEPDMFKCVSLNLGNVLPDPTPSAQSLREAVADHVDRWRRNGVRGVVCSLGVDTGSAALIAALAAVGFRFHHAAGSACCMLLWLAPGECNYPPYATHTVGAAGLVVRPDTGQMLVVTEAYDRASQHWKLPGGYAHIGENISEAAIREVREETGLETEAVDGLLAFRHLHRHRWGIADLYFACLLHPLPGAAVRLEPGGEIGDYRWVDPAEYAAKPTTSQTNRLIVDAYLRQLKGSGSAIGHLDYLGRGHTKSSRFYFVDENGATTEADSQRQSGPLANGAGSG
ncbi:hypothetical protein BOX15_Mlig029892g1, partial [Macrostomum lignano]